MTADELTQLLALLVDKAGGTMKFTRRELVEWERAVLEMAVDTLDGTITLRTHRPPVVLDGDAVDVSALRLAGGS